MLRLWLFLLLSTAVYSESPLDVATKINNRFKELFDSGAASQLVQELFHEGAALTGHGYASLTGQDLVDYFDRSRKGQGPIVDLKIISANETGDNLITAAVEMKLESMETILHHAEETIKDGKFTSFDMVLRDVNGTYTN